MATNGAIVVEHALTAGSDVWLSDAVEGWLKARVTKIDETQATVQTEKGDERVAAINALPLQNSDGRSGVEVCAWLSLA
jgi:Myosin N-terminal SH3-like domain